MHHYLVEVSDNGGTLALDHGIGLMEEGGDAAPYVAVEYPLQSFVVGLLPRAIDEPNALCRFVVVAAQPRGVVGVGDQMYPAYEIVEFSLLDERLEVVVHSRHIVYLQSQQDVDAAAIFLLQFTHFVAVGGVVFNVNGEGVVERQRCMAGETKGSEAVGKGEFNVFTWFALAIAEARMGVVVRTHRRHLKKDEDSPRAHCIRHRCIRLRPRRRGLSV